jgi:hypothetical protein
MHNVLKLGRKILTSVVTLSLVLSLAPALSVQAAVPASCPQNLMVGSQIKVNDLKFPAIYVLDNNLKSRFYASGWDYKTIQPDYTFNPISQSCLDTLGAPAQFPAAISRHPGFGVVKYVSLDTLFVVQPGNALAPIDEATAKLLHGTNYMYGNKTAASDKQKYYDNLFLISTRDFPHYTCRRPAVAAGKVYLGYMGLTSAGKKFVVDTDSNGSMVLREVMASGMASNYLLPEYFNRSVPDSALAGMGWGNPVTGAEMRFTDKTGSGWGCQSMVWNQPTSDTGTSTPPVVVTGNLTVSLSSAMTPAAGDVPAGGTANFTAVTLQAGAADVKVKEIVVTRTGNSGTADVQNITFVDTDGVPYGNIVSSLNSDHTGRLVFTTPLEIKANQSKTYYIRAGVPSSGATTGNTIALGIAKAADVVTESSSVGGTFPAMGNLMKIIGTTIGTAQVTNDGTVVDTTPDSGDKAVVINKFKITAGSTEDVTVENISFLESGTAALTDYANLELFDITDTPEGRL